MPTRFPVLIRRILLRLWKTTVAGIALTTFSWSNARADFFVDRTKSTPMNFEPMVTCSEDECWIRNLDLGQICPYGGADTGDNEFNGAVDFRLEMRVLSGWKVSSDWVEGVRVEIAFSVHGAGDDSSFARAFTITLYDPSELPAGKYISSLEVGGRPVGGGLGVAEQKLGAAEWELLHCNDGEHHAVDAGSISAIKELVVIGDTGAEDISPDADCRCDTRIDSLVLQDIRVNLANRDEDGDGYDFINDCNTRDPTIHPGATELPGDGVDQNCNWMELCYLDVDGDGLGSSQTGEIACPPLGEFSVHCGKACVAENGGALEDQGDCDDADPGVGACNTPLTAKEFIVRDSTNSASITFEGVSKYGDTAIDQVDCELDTPIGYVINGQSGCFKVETTATSASGTYLVCLEYPKALEPAPNALLKCSSSGDSCCAIPYDESRQVICPSTVPEPWPEFARRSEVNASTWQACVRTKHLSIFGLSSAALPTSEDADFDLHEDGVDNCPQHYNPSQQDTDGDGIGDACEHLNQPDGGSAELDSGFEEGVAGDAAPAAPQEGASADNDQASSDGTVLPEAVAGATEVSAASLQSVPNERSSHGCGCRIATNSSSETKVFLVVLSCLILFRCRKRIR